MVDVEHACLTDVGLPLHRLLDGVGDVRDVPLPVSLYSSRDRAATGMPHNHDQSHTQMRYSVLDAPQGAVAHGVAGCPYHK